MQPGDRVTVDQFGMRGKHGRIEAVRLDGTFDVRLDDPPMVAKRLAPGSLLRYQPPPPGSEEPAPSAPDVAGFQPGDRVISRMLGSRGKTGTVESVRPDGSLDVRLDDLGVLLKRMPASKMEAAEKTSED